MYDITNERLAELRQGLSDYLPSSKANRNTAVDLDQIIAELQRRRELMECRWCHGEGFRRNAVGEPCGACADCHGTGDSNWKRRRDGAALKTCSTCKGTGCEPESLRRAEAALSAKEGTP